MEESETVETWLPWARRDIEESRSVGHPMQREIERERDHPIQQDYVPVKQHSIMTPTWEPHRPAAAQVDDLIQPTPSDKFVFVMVSICMIGILAVSLWMILEF